MLVLHTSRPLQNCYSILLHRFLDITFHEIMNISTVHQHRRLYGFVHITAHEITNISTVHQHRRLHEFVHIMAHEITNISTGFVHITFHEIMTISTVHQHRCLHRFVLITTHEITNVSTVHLHRETWTLPFYETMSVAALLEYVIKLNMESLTAVLKCYFFTYSKINSKLMS